MKIRHGFVSNSSSTSFCIYGTRIANKSFDFTSKLDKLGLDYHEADQSGDDLYVGGSLTKCRDDQTMGDFKKEVVKKLKKILKTDDFKCDTLQDGWYNG